MIRVKKIMKVIVIVLLLICIIGILFLLFWTPFGRSPSKQDKESYEKKVSYFYDGIFHGDPEISVMSGNKSDFSKEENTIPKKEIPVKLLKDIPMADKDSMKVVWFGHSSSMLQLQGKNILIDPVLSQYSSPVRGFGSKRFSKIPIQPEQLPEIDMLVISHDHYDHLDYKTIKEVDSKVKEYLVPLGVDKHLLRWGVDEKKIHVMAWWDEVQIDDLRITSTPGRHYSGRLPWNNNTTLWSGYVFQNDKYKVYYTGDTGYGDFFQDIYNKFGAMDLMLLEDGQYDKAWEAIHMLPEQGIKAAETVQASWVIPVHWGAFSLSYHSWDDPIKQITKLGDEHGINIATPRIGEIVDFSKISDYQECWWK